MASAALASGAAFGALQPDGDTAIPGKVRLESFDFAGVKLRPGRWQKQYADARDFYLSLSNDDILHGFRAAAGLPAPGKPLGGWASKNSYETFGQWLMAMARASRANDDQALRDKAALLLTEWGKTIENTDIRPYAFEKMVGGLVDMHQYATHPEALGLLEKITDHAIATLNRARLPAQNLTIKMTQGDPLEWYTLAENLYGPAKVPGVRRSLAVSPILGEVPRVGQSHRCPGISRLQPSQYLQQRGHGLCGERRSEVPPDYPARLRFFPKRPMLCHGRLWPGGKTDAG